MDCGLLCLVPYDNSDRRLPRMWTALSTLPMKDFLSHFCPLVSTAIAVNDLFSIVMPRTDVLQSLSYLFNALQTTLEFKFLVSEYILDSNLTQAEDWALNSKHHYGYSQRDTSINNSLPEKMPRLQLVIMGARVQP